MRPDDYHSRAFIYPELVHGSQSGKIKVKVIDYINEDDPGSNKKIKQIKAKYEGVKNVEFWFGGFTEQALKFIED